MQTHKWFLDWLGNQSQNFFNKVNGFKLDSEKYHKVSKTH